MTGSSFLNLDNLVFIKNEVLLKESKRNVSRIMNYDREILRVLVEAGSEGLSVQKISRHVHYACNSFFNVIDFDEIFSHSIEAEAIILLEVEVVFHRGKNTQ